MTEVSDLLRHPNAIAIIGMAGRFPGARNLHEFQRNLEQGVESVTFFSDEQLLARGVDPQLLQQPNYVKAGAELAEVDCFDAAFFKYSTRDAELMDPQQRHFLECAWEALEQAGYGAEASRPTVGVFAGIGPVIRSYLFNDLDPYRASEPSTKIYVNNDKDFVSTRVSYKLNLRGPSLTVQAACATSLVAVHLACQSLLNGECDMALAGGATVSFPHGVGYLYHEDEMYSADGHCRAFDAQAQGTLFSSGIGIVVLKPLADALADGDAIAAVIRGSGVSNDGADKISFWATSAEGQVAAMRAALAVADIAPETIGYIETHGTATVMGDPIEIFALKRAYQMEQKQFCAIGSVKTNIGHTESAAGVIGLIKSVLALQQKVLYPTLHFRTPNPRIDFANSPFYVNTALQAWADRPFPRRAAVNALGIGGANAHVILEEAPALPAAANSMERTRHLLTLSAKTPAALHALAERYATALVAPNAHAFADICYTAAVGRTHFAHRLALVAATAQEAAQALSARHTLAGAMQVDQAQPSQRPRIAFLFTGQGAQAINMGRTLYETQPTFRQILDRCDQRLQAHLGESLLAILYPDEKTGSQEDKERAFTSTTDAKSKIQNPKSKIDETAYTQPALFVLEYALAELWRAWGIAPDMVIRHSIGEVAAACVAGVFSLEDGLKLIAARGRLMQALPANGMMANVWADAPQVQAAIQTAAVTGSTIAIAAINGPEQVVLSGERASVTAVIQVLTAQGIKSKELTVSHAFHSPLMAPMLADLRQVAETIVFAPPQIAFISTVTGELVADTGVGQPLNADYWVEHAQQPVCFAKAIATAQQLGCDVFLEIGPKPVLLGLTQAIYENSHLDETIQNPKSKIQNPLLLPSLHPQQEDWQQLLESLGILYRNGANIDWANVDGDYGRRRVALPTYPFERKRYRLAPVAPLRRVHVAASSAPNLHPLLGRRIASPLRAIQFETELSANEPAYLATHLLEGQPVFPAAAYYEMAFAAGVIALGTAQIRLEAVRLQTPLLLPAPETITLQAIVTPTEGGSECQIYSLHQPTGAAGFTVPEPQWTLHMSGLIKRSAQTEVLPDQTLPDLGNGWTVLAAEPTVLPADVTTNPIRIESLWRQPTRLVGRLHVSEAFLADGYYLHPQLLTTCLDLFNHLVDETTAGRYIQVGLEQLQLAHPLQPQMHFELTLREPAGEHAGNQPRARIGDLRLYDPSGRILAELTGIYLQPLAHGSLPAEQTWRQWLYTPEWRALPRLDLPGSQQTAEMPTPAARSGWLDRQWTPVADPAALVAHQTTIAHLDRLSVLYIQAALTQLGWQPVDGQRFTTTQLAHELQITPKYQRLWQRLLTILADSGLIEQFGEQSWAARAIPKADAAAALASLTQEIATTAPRLEGAHARVGHRPAELALLERCGANLAQVLHDDLNPLELLFPAGDLSMTMRLYHESFELNCAYRLAQQAVMALQQQQPSLRLGRRGLRILEIGAGTGSLTAHLLPHLDAQRTTYHFTDIGAAFLLKAQAQFSACPFLTVATLDIERDPLSQGFAAHSYDLIVAANVLHATQDLQTTLQHVRRLLAPHGCLLLVEVTQPQTWIDLVFGLTDGWWRFTDTTLRPNHPLLTATQWIDLLTATGFQQPCALQANAGEADTPPLSSSVLVAQAPTADGSSPSRHWVLLTQTAPKGGCPQGAIGAELGAQLQTASDTYTLVYPGPIYTQCAPHVFQMTDSLADFQRLFAAIGPVHGVVHDWQTTTDDPATLTLTELTQAVATGTRSALHLTQALIELPNPPALWIVTHGSQAPLADAAASVTPGRSPSISASAPIQVVQAPLWGLGRAIALEHPELHCTLVDLPVESTTKQADQVTALLEELLHPQDEGQVAFVGGRRYVARLARWAPPPTQPPPVAGDGAYLITGGLGGIGLQVAQWLVEQGARHLLLLGRRSPDESVQAQLQSLAAKGAQVMTAQADVADAKQLAEVLAAFGTTMPPLRGVIHAAGIFEDRLLRGHTWASFEKVFAPKVAGAWHLHCLTRHLSLDFFVLFSAGASLIGMSGLSNYVAANTFLDALAHYRRQQKLPALTINWGGWQATGMAAAVNQQRASQWDVLGIDLMAPATALAALSALLSSDGTQVGVLPINWPSFLAQQRIGSQSQFFADFVATVADPQALAPASRPAAKAIPDHFVEELAKLPAQQRYERLWQHVQQQLAGVLGSSVADLSDWHYGFTDMGLDSLTALEFRNRLQTTLACHLPSTLIFKYPRLDVLVDYLATALVGVTIPLAGETGGQATNGQIHTTQTTLAQQRTTAAPATILAEVAALSAAEVEASMAQELAELEALLNGKAP